MVIFQRSCVLTFFLCQSWTLDEHKNLDQGEEEEEDENDIVPAHVTRIGTLFMANLDLQADDSDAEEELTAHNI